MPEHMPRLRDPVHFWHLYVCENASVSDVATSLRHALEVHVNCDEAIDCLVTLAPILALDDRLKGHQVEHDVIDEQDFGLATALFFLFVCLSKHLVIFVFFGRLFLEDETSCLPLFWLFHNNLVLFHDQRLLLLREC